MWRAFSFEKQYSQDIYDLKQIATWNLKPLLFLLFEFNNVCCGKLINQANNNYWTAILTAPGMTASHWRHCYYVTCTLLTLT